MERQGYLSEDSFLNVEMVGGDKEGKRQNLFSAGGYRKSPIGREEESDHGRQM